MTNTRLNDDGPNYNADEEKVDHKTQVTSNQDSTKLVNQNKDIITDSIVDVFQKDDGPNYTADEENTAETNYNYIPDELLRPFFEKRFSNRFKDEINEIMPTKENWGTFGQGGWKRIFAVFSLPINGVFNSIYKGVEGLDDMEFMGADKYYRQILPDGRELRLGVERTIEKHKQNQPVTIDYQIIKTGTFE